MTARPLPTRFRFTQRAIDQLPPRCTDSPSRFDEYSDAEVTGLRLLVNRQGRKWFYVRTTFRRQKRAVKLGEYPALSLGDARRKALEIRAGLDRGIDPALVREQERSMPTFAEFAVRDYMPFARETKRSADSDLSKLKVHLVPRFGTRPLDEITLREIQTYHAQLRHSHSPATANRHLSLLSKLFGCAVQWGLLQRNPCAGVTKCAEPNAQPRILSVEEIRRLYQAMEEVGTRSDMPVAALKFLLLTGTRKNEALHAKWEHVDLARGIWFLPQTKNGKSYHVLLNDEAKTLLRSLRPIPGSPWVFPGRNPAQPLVEVRRCLNRLAKAAGIPPLRVHSLRHSFASLAAQSGASLLQIQALLNHASMATTQRYAHLVADDLRAASQTVATAISNALKET
jgi:integrase